MSLFESLYTGVSGMNAQSKATGMISTNIANLNTVGYKRSDTAFADIVANKTKPNNFSHGAVIATEVARISQQGQIMQTSSMTDVGIAGNGFFVVSQNPAAGGDYLFTRNGSFMPDNQGYLRNTSGFYLHGWPIDESGNVSSGMGLSSVQPINIAELNAVPLPTTRATLMMNLDSSQQPINPQIAGGTLPVTNEEAHFSRAITVYDGNGTPRNLQFEYRKITGPMAYATTNNSLPMNASDVLADNPGGPTPGITAGDQLVLSAGGDTLTVPIAPDMTVRDVINQINNFTNGGGNRVFDAHLNAQGRMVIRATDPSAELDLSAADASVTGATGLNFAADTVNPGTPLVYSPMADITANGAANPNQSDFPDFADTDTPNPYGWWEVSVKIPDPANPNAPNPAMVEISKGLINFDGNGTLNATPGSNGNIMLSLGTINFDNAINGDETAINVDIGGFQQYAGDYSVTFAEQNGAAPGTLTNIEISREGRVVGKFSNGASIDLFQIPLASFTNPDGLKSISGTAFAMTADAGEMILEVPGEGGTGTLQSAALENANVDLANEFAKLIVSQRAFSANSRVVNTVDEMTELLRSLKR